ncbi:MAG TPA: sugar nucleotide-binding protein [Tepidisphaeraceae bacterium]|jgi:dTDP-4-dehydrorhamnose reductase
MSPHPPKGATPPSAVPLKGFLGDGRKPVAILGGAGILGAAMADVLTRCNVPCVALGRLDCDITSPADIEWLLHEVKPTCIVNCAAVTDLEARSDDAETHVQVNGEAVGRLASACRALSVPLVHFSCASVFDGGAAESCRRHGVGDSARPLSPCAQSKALGEQLLQRFAPPQWLLVRTSWLFGTLSRDFVGRLLTQSQSQPSLEPIHLTDGSHVGAPTFSADLSRAVLLLMIAGATGVWHVSNGGAATWDTVARAVLRAWNRPPHLRLDPAPSSPSDSHCGEPESRTPPPQTLAPPLPLRSSLLDCSSTYLRLGLRLRRWEQALLDYARAANGPAEAPG